MSQNWVLYSMLNWNCSTSQFYWDKNQMCNSVSWWRHRMETFSALLTICAGNSPVPGEFPSQRPVTRSFDVFFDLRLNKRLSKQSWGWWFETLSRSLWRHRNVIVSTIRHIHLFACFIFDYVWCFCKTTKSQITTNSRMFVKRALQQRKHQNLAWMAFCPPASVDSTQMGQ